MKRAPVRLLRLALLAALATVLPGAIPTPEDFAGFPIGSDGNLLRWERIVEYFRILDRESDRVVVDELGKSTNGNPFILAVISSPKNLARLPEIREHQRRFAHPAGLTETEIDELAWSSPAVVAVSCSIHATELGATQMAVELAYRMATENSPWMANVLDNVVFLLVPSLNPDGQIIVTDWNDRVRGTEHVWAPLPWLYHPYVGHDNNRDSYMMTQAESRLMNKLLFQDWFPQVYVDEHQQGQTGMRVFVPPFRNPINPNVHPSVWALAGQIGFSMYQSLHEAGFTGVGYGSSYTGWWQGGFLRGAWFHNMVGMLTEVASANLASPTYQEAPGAGGKSRAQWLDEREKNPEAAMPAPADLAARYEYPRPWRGGKWTLRDIVDADLAITTALLERAAHDRVRLIRTQIRMGLDSVAEGERGDPWAYVFPAAQHDPGALYRLLEVLHYAGVEVERAAAPFSASGRTYAEGDYLIRMAQPFRAYAKDLLETQRHPDPNDLPRGAMGDRPYDVTTWSLPLQMGVEAREVKERFEVRASRLDEIPAPEGRWRAPRGSLAGVAVRAEPNAAATLANRAWKEGGKVGRLTAEARIEGEVFPVGSLWIAGAPAARLEAWAGELGLRAAAASAAPRGVEFRQRPRTALYRPWTASMDEGWTRWLLEQHEFAFSPVFNADLRAGGLGERWDVVLLPGDRGETSLLDGNDRASTPAEYRGGLGEEGRQALREFVAAGGTLVAWGDATQFVLRSFETPLRDALDGVGSNEFSCPGCYVRVQVDNRHPLGYGMPAEATAVFDDNAAFETVPGFGFTELRPVARFPGERIFQSGWIRGERRLAHRVAAAEVRYEQGRLIVIGFRPQFRAQPHGTFKLLFNAIFLGGRAE